jgi:hypothetical protein
VSGGFFNGFAHFILTVEVEDIVDKVEGVLVVVNFGVQAGEVEAVGQVFFVDLTEVFITAGGDELANGFVSLVVCIMGGNESQE